MFQDNPLLAQLKQQLYSQTPCAEGVVKGTERGFDFLEMNAQKGYLIPPPQMKKVMRGDRIIAVIHSEEDRGSTEPGTLVEPFLARFVGEAQRKDDRLAIAPSHPLLKDATPCRAARGVGHDFRQGDWAVAEMCRHPLKGDRGFYAELTQFITFSDDHFASWWVTLARRNLEKEAPGGVAAEMLGGGLTRRDLTALDFVTIDSASIEDMDDTLYAESTANGRPLLTAAIVDPTAWIAEGSRLDKTAKVRVFTNYLPGFNIPMLSRELSDGLCSLRADEVRPVLACQMTLTADGTIEDNIEFSAAAIESKAKLAYDDVSNWLEGRGSWQPGSDAIAQQITLLKDVCQRRSEWHQTHTLVFKGRPDYRFVLDERGRVLDIVAGPRHITNRIVEESMIATNICVARVLRDKLGFGVYNVHTGSDPTNTEQLATLLEARGVYVDPTEVLTLEEFCKLCRELDAQPTGFLGSCIHRFQSFVKISTEPGLRSDLGPEAYVTWTSPICKYSDMINHRLLKAIVEGKAIARPQDDATIQMAERRRLNQVAERDVVDWLYARFLSGKAGTDTRFVAEIIGISHGGIRAHLVDNDTVAFTPAPFLHTVRDELVCSQGDGTVQIKGEVVYKVADVIDVTIVEVRIEARSIIARPAA